MKQSILTASCVSLLFYHAEAQIVTSGGITLSGSRGSLDGTSDLSFSGIAFADGLIGNGAFAPSHTVPNVNDGNYGNASSWIGGGYIGLSWGNVGQTIQRVAFGRDNTATFGDRSAGLYTLQYTTADLSSLAIPNSGSTAGVVGSAADGSGWITVGTIHYQGPDGSNGNPTAQSYRNQFDLGFSLSGVTGIRLIAPSGVAIDQFEAYSSPAGNGAMSSMLNITPTAGYTIGWDGNDGANFSAADPAVVPANLALGATAISSSDLGPQLSIGYHVKGNLNDGLYGNNKSWISSSADTLTPFGGVTFTGGARHVSGVAWGRDNGNSVGDGPNQQFTDRALGTYTLQSLNPDDNTTWDTLGTFQYTGSDDATVGGGFTAWLRHQYSLANAGGALRSGGIRLIVPYDGFGSNAIDELEVYGTTMTWTNGASTGNWNLNGDANFAGAADGKFLNQDAVKFGNAGAGTINLTGNLNTSGVTVESSANYVFTGSGSLAGTGALTKSGTGSLTLVGAHSYSGATTVSRGSLVLDFSAAGAPASNILNQTSNLSALQIGGATLQLIGKANTTNSQRFNGTTLQPGATNIQLLANTTANPLSINLGAITRQVGSTVQFTMPTGTLSGSNGVVTSTGSAGTILTADGVAFATIGTNDWAAQSAGATHLVGLSTLGGYTDSTSSTLAGNANVASGVNTTLATSTDITSLRFDQNESRNISIATGQTLKTGGILITGNVATAGSSISGGSLAGAAGKDLVVIQHSAQSFQISSVIADNTSATGLTKAGSGTLALSGLNTFTGNVLVSAGTLELSGSSASANALGANVAGRTITVSPGATLVSTATDAVDYFSTTQNLLAFRIQGTWENNPANTAGTGFQRTDNLTLQGATINDRGQHGGDYGGILMNGIVNVTGTSASAYNQLGNGMGLGVLATTFNVADVSGDSAADFIVNGAIRNTPVGVGSFQKTGIGTMVLNGPTANTGNTTITAGKLSLQGNSAGAISNIWIGNGATLSADVVSGNNRHDIIGNLTLAGGTLAGNSNISDTNTGHFFLGSIGQQVIVHGDEQSLISADTHVSGTKVFNVADGAADVDLLVTGKLSHHHTVAWGGIVKSGLGTMHLASSMDGTNAAGASGIYGLGGIELAGGTLIFSGSTGYSAFSPGDKSGYHLADFSGNATLKWDVGNTKDVSALGNLRIRDGVTATLDTNGNNVLLGTAIANGVTGTGAMTKAGTGTLTLAGDNTYTGGTSVLSGTLQLGNGGASGSVTGNISNQGTVVFNRSDDATFGGVISGSGGVVQDGFIVRFAAAQTYTGPTTIKAGAYLVLPSTVDQGLAAETIVTIENGGSFDISNRQLTIAGLSGGGSLYSFNANNGHLTLNVATGQTHTFSGSLGGPFPNFGLTKSGLGTQTLSGTNTHTGDTSVTGGALMVNGAMTSSTTTVYAGGTLGGIGITGAVNVLSGGTLSPGTSPGLLTTGNLALFSGSTLRLEIDTTVPATGYDQLAVNGSLSLGSATLELTGSYLTAPLATGDIFMLVLNDSSDAITGTFFGLPDGAQVTSTSGQTFAITYFADSTTSSFTGGNDVAIMAVPEPGTLFTILGACSVMATRRRRKV